MFAIAMMLVVTVFVAGMQMLDFNMTDNLMEKRRVTEVASIRVYASAAEDYAKANPGTTGNVTQAAMSPYLPTWYANMGWTATIVAGTPNTLYVWGQGSGYAAGGGYWDILEMGKGSMLYGYKNSAGQFVSAKKGVLTSVSLPASITVGALVIIRSV